MRRRLATTKRKPDQEREPEVPSTYLQNPTLGSIAMFGLNPMELLIIGGLAVLLFGSRLPSVARSLGKSMTEFKRGLTDIQDEVRKSDGPA
jgi:TatA/E family protein of Tat protein translocase